ncbi:unnamed protein product, partial [marine sediment metagenome]
DNDGQRKRDKYASGKVTVTSIGPWIWVKARISGGYTRKWYSRADSEYTDCSMEFWHDWIGLSENAPSKITRPEELETWALLSAAYEHYQREPLDLDDDSYLRCSGRWVEDVSEDGKVTMNIGSVSKGTESIWITLECVHDTEYFQL